MAGKYVDEAWPTCSAKRAESDHIREVMSILSSIGWAYDGPPSVQKYVKIDDPDVLPAQSQVEDAVM